MVDEWDMNVMNVMNDAPPCSLKAKLNPIYLSPQHQTRSVSSPLLSFYSFKIWPPCPESYFPEITVNKIIDHIR